MKKIHFLFLILLTVLLITISNNAFSQPPPPPDPANTTFGNKEVGGSASIANGTTILVILGFAYLGRKRYLSIYKTDC